MNDDTIKKIAKLLTDDPDIFNEMAVSTGAIAMGPGNVPVRQRKRKKRPMEDDGPEDYKANPVTGKPKKGEVLYSDTTSEEGADEAV